MHENGDLDAEMRGFYADYIDAFNRSDYQSILRYFAHPWVMIVGSAEPHVVSTEQKQLLAYQQVSARIKEQGWVRSGVDKLEVFSTGVDTGLVASVFSRYRRDGTIIETKRAYYVLRRGSAGWKIVTIFELPMTPPTPPA
jgi:ketosteroid isomerase-like protein